MDDVLVVAGRGGRRLLFLLALDRSLAFLTPLLLLSLGQLHVAAAVLPEVFVGEEERERLDPRPELAETELLNDDVRTWSRGIPKHVDSIAAAHHQRGMRRERSGRLSSNDGDNPGQPRHRTPAR